MNSTNIDQIGTHQSDKSSRLHVAHVNLILEEDCDQIASWMCAYILLDSVEKHGSLSLSL